MSARTYVAAEYPPTMPAIFPFAALLGQERLQLALTLAAIDPGLGGVLISGPRGTAKSTAARGLAELLPSGRFVTLPLGASEERLLGTLDLGAALREADVRFAPGLLADAHQGVLYVDEVNLLSDALVDLLLDVASSGVNTVERDGVSHRHAARFVLIGTMNREEGELRPQLLDRFGLSVELANCYEPELRRAIVATRLAFDDEPDAFRARHLAAQAELRERIARARATLRHFRFDDAVQRRVGELCIAAAVDGVRADLVMLRAARALAAFEAAPALDVDHVGRVAELVLAHRAHATPASPSAPPAGSAPLKPAAGDADRASGAATSAAMNGRPDRDAAGRAGQRSIDGADGGPGAGHAPPGASAPSSSSGVGGVSSSAGHVAHGQADRDWGYLPPLPVEADVLPGGEPTILKKA